jgi:hypothetical protein
MPEAIFEAVELEQGTITMASKGLDPEARGDDKSSFEKTFLA